VQIQKPQAQAGAGSIAQQGDKQFLQDVEKKIPSLKETAMRLLILLREIYPQGQLYYYPTSDEYKESTDKSFVLKIVPIDKQVVVTIYGLPEKFKGIESFQLKRGGSQSTKFSLQNIAQLNELSTVLRQSAAMRQTPST